MRIFKLLIGILLVPFVCAGVYTYGIFFFEFTVKSFSSFWSFWAGILAYPAFQWFVYNPVRFYIIEHELTHALFAIFCGSKVKRISISRVNGKVLVDKANTLITLSPYFFPLFAIFFFLCWRVAGLFYPVIYRYVIIFYFVSGFLLSFHFFMTTSAILQGQSDLKHSGTVFSLAVIFILYILISVFFLKYLFGGKSSAIELNAFFLQLKNNAVYFYTAVYNFFSSHICPLILKTK